jgi:amidohydrolase
MLQALQIPGRGGDQALFFDRAPAMDWFIYKTASRVWIHVFNRLMRFVAATQALFTSGLSRFVAYNIMRLYLPFLFLGLATGVLFASTDINERISARIDAEYPSLDVIYRQVHANPELSLMEVKTSALVAKELRAAGLAVTENVGGYGVVGVLANGPGPTLLLRSDMDALPLAEVTGLPYASTALVKDASGREQPAMHACAHDTHVAWLIGAARVLSALRADWQGTIVFVAQPAEEIGLGARAMLADGLYTRFPKPDFALAGHTWSNLPAGVVASVEGPAYANVDSLDILVRGIGGHGSRPQTTKDPVVLAAQIVVALQTIVSRELEPGTPAVVTVGSIHGGTKHNIIPDEVKLELTLRSYDIKVADQLIASIRRIAENTARAAGVPDDLLPIVKVVGNRTPVLTNNPALTRRVTGAVRVTLGEANTWTEKPTAAGEDFSRYGLTPENVPVCMLWIGGADPAAYAESQRTGVPLPSNHSPTFAPVPEPTIKTGLRALTAAALELLKKP